MKAVVYEKYGPPEVLQVREVAEPVPKDDEVLINPVCKFSGCEKRGDSIH